MNKFCLFIAYRYLFFKKYEHGISSMIIMSWLSIMISSTILILISGIMNGFEHETVSFLQGLHAPITIEAKQEQLHVPALTAFFNTDIQEIQSWAPQTTQYGCLYKPNSSIKPVLGSILFIDPLREPLVRSLQKYLIDAKMLNDALGKTTVIVGQALAACMQLSVGDDATLLLVNNDVQEDELFSYETEQVKIGAIIKTGIDEIDMHTIFCSYELYEKIYGEVFVDQLHVTINPSVDSNKVIQKIKMLTGLIAFSWQDNYPALFDALRLEKRMAELITFLIVLMAMMSIIALLFMFVQSKKADITLLLILGSSVANVRAIFMIMAFVLVSSAALFGVFLAFLCGYVINNCELFPLPDAYFVSRLTVLFDPGTVFFWYMGILIIGFFAMLIPLRTISDSAMQDTVRFER